MDKLKPCPFCGNEPTLYQDEMTGHWAVRCVKDTHRPTLLNSHGATAWCYSCTDPAEAIAAWNTRAERTCHIVRVDADPDRVLESIMPKGYSVFFERCSECGETIPSIKESTERANYCPSCGAKVVNTDE